MEKLFTFFFCCFALLSVLNTTCVALDSITTNDSISDGGTIVSAGESFELGFLNLPPNSKNRYLGIWYKKISTGTVVWVANRETPLTSNSGVLRLNGDGMLQLFSGDGAVIWLSNSSVSVRSVVPVMQLLDNGNLVVRDLSSGDSGNLIWQSFDHPGDTFLPGSKFGKNLVTGQEIYATSWKSLDDPSPGEYKIWTDTNGYPQILLSQGSAIHARLGPWNGVRFSGVPSLKTNPNYVEDFVIDEKEVYYTYDLVNGTGLLRFSMNPDGVMQQLIWIDRTRSWFVLMTLTIDSCSRFGVCGPFGICNIRNSPACGCLDGFEPRNQDEWNQGDWSSGCRRKTHLNCWNDGFRKITNIEVPDTRYSRYNRTMTLGECEIDCKRNCNCTAFTNLDIRDGGSGCLQWFGDLVDVREYPDVQDLYVRMAASDLLGHTVPQFGSNKGKRGVIKVVLPVSAAVVLLGLVLAAYACKKLQRSDVITLGRPGQDNTKDYNESRHEVDLPLFSLSKIVKATDNFSINNKLGEGGFGPVYKGVLECGREIAVKRLSKDSAQGVEEFKNEVMCIARLQHRNLVKLLGYCIQEDELMLIYEYLPNKSLDLFIFGEHKNRRLDWPQRFSVIHGIARGLVYLHQDSRLRIIHRDLKAGNILLDHDMTPKISDFGLARRFTEYENKANTNKVVGTYGYISPEYAVNGTFSVKSDVFSFGVLLLEIVSGRKNRGFHNEDHSDTLLGHAWRLHREGRSLEVMSAHLRDSCVISEVLRSIHIGLLCVQHRAEDRPTMSSVVLMLGNEGVLRPPKQPAFFTDESMARVSSNPSTPTPVSVNDITITLLDVR